MTFAAVRVERHDWDSSFWEVEAVRVQISDASELAAAELRCRELGACWASMSVPGADLTLLSEAVRSGYDVVDVRFTMKVEVATMESTAPWQPAEANESEAIISIARDAFRNSRFFTDPHLPNERCQDFYGTWARNSMTGQLADVVLLEREREHITGFVTVRLGDDGNASLPLVATSPQHQGRGVASRMLEQAISWTASNGAVRLEVVTQLSNTAAIRTYESAGFRFAQADVWLHRWFGD